VATRQTIHIVSHGPHCLDGMAAAVAVARFHDGAAIHTQFASPTEVDRVLRGVEPAQSSPAQPSPAQPSPAQPSNDELWITDISWREPATDAHLQRLAASGVAIYWFDHHRTAINRYRGGEIRVPFTDHVVSDEFAASRLVYEYLTRRLAAEKLERPRFRDLAHLIAMADDNDRWLHRVAGSRTLALVVSALGADSYDELLRIGPDVGYTPRMAATERRVQHELQRSFEIADATRKDVPLPGGIVLVAAMCDGYTSEVADRWGQQMTRAVFALYDARSLSVSLRRSPDCEVDLSRLAERLGGGGHAAAAGCELPAVRADVAARVADAVAEAIVMVAEDRR
jgi:oligoribonuclease NrnB/cAMP/cGMP phosphodiesterase (DHH superfamily)